MSVERDLGPDDELYTVDELAAATGMTVRTTRYYAGLGLLPAPTRRGRMAYYTEEHRARLELIRALQDHGFTLVGDREVPRPRARSTPASRTSRSSGRCSPRGAPASASR